MLRQAVAVDRPAVGVGLEGQVIHHHPLPRAHVADLLGRAGGGVGAGQACHGDTVPRKYPVDGEIRPDQGHGGVAVVDLLDPIVAAAGQPYRHLRRKPVEQAVAGAEHLMVRCLTPGVVLLESGGQTVEGVFPRIGRIQQPARAAGDRQRGRAGLVHERTVACVEYQAVARGG